MRRAVLLALGALLLSCSEKKKELPELKALAPPPLPQVLARVEADGGDEREALFEVKPAPVFGEEPPGDAVRLELVGEAVRLGAELYRLDRADASRLRERLGNEPRVLLLPDDEVFLVQAAPALAALDDSGARVFLAHPQGGVAFPLVLRDEPAFREWLDEPKPGKVRVIHRADGFEVQTNQGKLPGPDQNGPSVPVRGGKADVLTLRRALAEVKSVRFSKAPDVCFVPSFAMPMRAVAAAMTANFRGEREPIYDETCLVYPRPPERDVGR